MLQLVPGCCHSFSGGADVSDMSQCGVRQVCVWPDKVMMGEQCEARLISPDKPHGSSLNGRMCLISGLSVTQQSNLKERQCCHCSNHVSLLTIGYWKVIVVSELQVYPLVSIVSQVISSLLLSVKLHLTLWLNLMFGLWQALLEHTSHNSGKW